MTYRLFGNFDLLKKRGDEPCRIVSLHLSLSSEYKTVLEHRRSDELDIVGSDEIAALEESILRLESAGTGDIYTPDVKPSAAYKRILNQAAISSGATAVANGEGVADGGKIMVLNVRTARGRRSSHLPLTTTG